MAKQTKPAAEVAETETDHAAEVTEQPAPSQRVQNTLELAHKMADAVERRELAQDHLAECKEELKTYQGTVKDAQRAVDSIQEEIAHLVKLIVGNERGQLPLDFEGAKSQQTLPGTGDNQPATTTDQGAALSLSVLLEFGLTASKLEQFQQSKFGATTLTVGHLETLMRDSQGHYWKDVKGWGESFAQGDGENAFLQVYGRFRQAWPMNGEQPHKWRKCLNCQFVYSNANRCKHCKSTTWEPAEQIPETVPAD